MEMLTGMKRWRQSIPLNVEAYPEINFRQPGTASASIQ